MRGFRVHPSLSVMRSHPLLLVALYMPVVASVLGASLVDQFRWFYLLIPGFWCWFVGCFLIHAFVTGMIEDNTGRAVRSTNPIRFWSSFAVWALGYTFALALPVGLALQERAGQKKPPSEMPTPD